MSKYISIGFNNSVNSDKIIAILNSDTLPAKKLVQQRKTEGLVLDCTCGRKTKSVVVTSERIVILSIVSAITLTARLNGDVEDKLTE